MTRADRSKTQDTTPAPAETVAATPAGRVVPRRTARSLDDMQETPSPLVDDQGRLLEQALKTRSRRRRRSGSAEEQPQGNVRPAVGSGDATGAPAVDALLFQVICESGPGREVQIPQQLDGCPGLWNSQVSSGTVPVGIGSLQDDADRQESAVTADLIAARLSELLNEHFEQLGAALQSQLAGGLEQLLVAGVSALPARSAADLQPVNSVKAAATPSAESVVPRSAPREPVGAASRNLSRSWEEIRQELFDEVERKSEAGYLADLPIELPTEPAPPTGMRDAVFSPEEGGYVPADFSPSDDLVLTEIPQHGELEAMSADELRALLQQRESLMARLIYRLRCREETRLNLLTLDQLRTMQRELPVELATLIESSVRRSDNLTRLGELELAFERARLAREKNNLQQSRQLMDVLAKQLGFTVNSDGTLVRQAESQPRTGSRRWLGKLGFGQQVRE
ncbi:MAG: hypothetical protein ACK6EB_20080 [Planctomyces sp.]